MPAFVFLLSSWRPGAGGPLSQPLSRPLAHGTPLQRPVAPCVAPPAAALAAPPPVVVRPASAPPRSVPQERRTLRRSRRYRSDGVLGLRWLA
jgi:hypothetical protein